MHASRHSALLMGNEKIFTLGPVFVNRVVAEGSEGRGKASPIIKDLKRRLSQTVCRAVSPLSRVGINTPPPGTVNVHILPTHSPASQSAHFPSALGPSPSSLTMRVPRSRGSISGSIDDDRSAGPSTPSAYPLMRGAACLSCRKRKMVSSSTGTAQVSTPDTGILPLT